MANLFTGLSRQIVKKPVLTLFMAILIIALLLVGALKISMATGTETFIDTESQTYQDNAYLEETFGGENIVVLLTAENLDTLLTAENLAKLAAVEQTFTHSDSVYTVISPATMVKEMTTKQAATMLAGVSEMKDGLTTMSSRLLDVAASIRKMKAEMPNVDFSKTAASFQELTSLLDNLITGQKQLPTGIAELGSGYNQFGTLAAKTGTQIKLFSGQFAQMLETLPLEDGKKNELRQQTAGLAQAGEMLTEAGSKMTQISWQAGSMAEAPLQTAQGLEKMKNGLRTQVKSLQQLQQQMPDLSQLDTLAAAMDTFSQNLLTIAQGLETMLAQSNIMYPGLPRSQQTLELLLYEESGELRPLFNQTIVDQQHALMMIKLQGQLSDAEKEEVVEQLNNALTRNKLTSVKTTVTGKPVLDMVLRSEMRQSMQKMVVLAVLLMVAIITLIFNVRWRLFPLVVNFIAVLATMGLLGHLQLPMTMVSMAAFPILIGLGIDYSIQFHSRYEEEYWQEASSNEL
ncbi:MAG TPA: MMPL family transporter [Oscillospiraceae bacterium]|nr:MMPL family transporter [Oscillospiraceae bacterium]